MTTNQELPRNRAYINFLELRNFRAFESQAIRFAPLTILVGPNNAGKSSIISSIRLLAQTLQSEDWEVPLLLGEFGTFKDIIYGNNSRRILGLSVGFTYEGVRGCFNINFKYRAQRREIILRDFQIYDGEGRSLLKTQYSKDSERQIVKELKGIAEETTRQVTKPIRVVHFLPRVLPLRIELDRLKKDKKLPFTPTKILYQVDQISRRAAWVFQSVQYLGPFREKPSRMYPFSGERPSFPGPTGRGATDILVADFFRRGTRKQELTKLVKSWLSKANIATELLFRQIGGNYEIRVQHPETGEAENLADVGYGISQILPVIVSGHNLQPGAIFIVEQPEIHLHPSAQAELGDFFLDLYRKGVQCIIETHSEHLIMRLQRHVADGHIPPADVAVKYVMSGKTSKEVVELPLNEDGLFTKPWPKGFFEERLKEARELARAPLRRKGEI